MFAGSQEATPLQEEDLLRCFYDPDPLRNLEPNTFPGFSIESFSLPPGKDKHTSCCTACNLPQHRSNSCFLFHTSKRKNGSIDSG